MTQTALITGASNGIGKELAFIHAQKGGDLVLVARSQDKLNELAEQLRQQFRVNVTVIAVDLSLPNVAQRIFDKTQELGIQVDILINNAGVGGHGLFAEQSLSSVQNMVNLNIQALTDLTHFYLQGMIARQQGKIHDIKRSERGKIGKCDLLHKVIFRNVSDFTFLEIAHFEAVKFCIEFAKI